MINTHLSEGKASISVERTDLVFDTKRPSVYNTGGVEAGQERSAIPRHYLFWLRYGRAFGVCALTLYLMTLLFQCVGETFNKLFSGGTMCFAVSEYIATLYREAAASGDS